VHIFYIAFGVVVVFIIAILIMDILSGAQNDD
jgi:phage shock protein PspC (stress-responsive transcriptional regulator)